MKLSAAAVLGWVGVAAIGVAGKDHHELPHGHVRGADGQSYNALQGGVHAKDYGSRILNDPSYKYKRNSKPKHGDPPGVLTPFQGDRVPPLPTMPNQHPRHSNRKRKVGWNGKCLAKDGSTPLKFTTIFNNEHLGDDAHKNPDEAHLTAKEICIDLCHHYHQWCLAVELKAPSAAGRGQHNPPECSLITDQITFEDAGGLMHDPRWGGRQHFYEDNHVYHTYCGGGGCHFVRSPSWHGGKPNEEKGFKCIPALGFPPYVPLPEGYLPGYHKKGGPQKRVRPHRNGAAAGSEKMSNAHKPKSGPAGKPARSQKEESLDELRRMKEQLDKKLERLEAHMDSRDTA